MAKCKRLFQSSDLQTGFTLMELMVTIGIAAVLAGLAAPSIGEFIAKNRMNSVVSEFSGGILRARNEAVSKNTCVTLCMSDSSGDAAPACTTSGKDWQLGWIAFLNTSCDATSQEPAASNDLIFSRVASDSDILLEAKGDSPVKKLMFTPSGAPSSSGISEFGLLYKNEQHIYTQQHGVNVCVDARGRSRTIPVDQKCSSF